MDQAAPGIAYNGVKAEPAAGRRWHQLVAPIYFGGPKKSRVVAPETYRRRAQEDQRLSELMVGAQAGDKARYARLLAACETLVRRAAGRMGVQSDLIEDVVQETLITMHNARQTYDPSRSFSAWLSVIAQRRAIDALRRSGRHGRREAQSTPQVAPMTKVCLRDRATRPRVPEIGASRTLVSARRTDRLQALLRAAGK